ncbi:MAG: quinol:electron acceptor oxidoreductase subunit ActD [Pseudomonadota bacterium]
MAKYHTFTLFSDFEEAFGALADIRVHKIPGISIDDVTLQSPIEHPEIEEVLGDRPVHVQKFTFFGAVFGVTFGFLFLAAAEASFLAQPQGGKPIIPLPSNIVLMYEMLIFFGVWTTVFAFIFLAGLVRKRGPIYSEQVNVDQIAVIIDVDEKNLDALKKLFTKHKALEFREEKLS